MSLSFALTLWCSFAVAQGKRIHTARALEVTGREKVDAWSIGEVVEWPQVQEELMSSMESPMVSTSQLSPESTPKLRKALDKLGSWTGGLFGRQRCQMNGLLKDLIKACEAIGPRNKWILQISSRLPWSKNPFEGKLPEKTCTESAKDLFIYGDELVKTLSVPPQQVKDNYDGRLKPPIPLNELKMIQSLWFLQNWLLPMATAKSSALLWAGFWDGDTSNRTTKTKLFDFAKDVDHQTVHPDTELGRLIEKHRDLSKCHNDTKLKKLTDNMWSFASMSFVLGMPKKDQGTVVALLNKDINGERPLKESILFRHEVPTVGVAAWGTDALWSPQFLLIDMKGTCHKTSQLLRNQLFTRLSSWKPKTRSEWRDFRKKSELAWTCIDCPPGHCELNKNLANYVSNILQA